MSTLSSTIMLMLGAAVLGIGIGVASEQRWPTHRVAATIAPTSDGGRAAVFYCVEQGK